MVRNYKKKSINLEERELRIQEAINEVMEGKCLKRATKERYKTYNTILPNQKIEDC